MLKSTVVKLQLLLTDYVVWYPITSTRTVVNRYRKGWMWIINNCRLVSLGVLNSTFLCYFSTFFPTYLKSYCSYLSQWEGPILVRVEHPNYVTFSSLFIFLCVGSETTCLRAVGNKKDVWLFACGTVRDKLPVHETLCGWCSWIK